MTTIKKSNARMYENGLVLNSLRVDRYRCFEHLEIQKLGRANLIVGKNGVGKSSLLEALWIYANAGYELRLYEILQERNEIPPADNADYRPGVNAKGLRNLLFNRPSTDYIAGEYPSDFDNDLSFLVGENIDISGSEPVPVAKLLQIRIQRSPGPNSLPNISTIESSKSPEHSFLIKAGGLTDIDLVDFWDRIEKLVLEDLVIDALKIVNPELKDIRFSGYPNGSNKRIPVVRLANAKERVPLRSLGDGMTRLLGMASALINCGDGILLIDEIESGIHYSALTDLWKLIFKTARRMNVQVFATTHSKDCVEAFAAAAAESEEDGVLIRLERHGENIIAKAINEDMLVEAVNYEVEVR